jgi:hypothetical protein
MHVGTSFDQKLNTGLNHHPQLLPIKTGCEGLLYGQYNETRCWETLPGKPPLPSQTKEQDAASTAGFDVSCVLYECYENISTFFNTPALLPCPGKKTPDCKPAITLKTS